MSNIHIGMSTLATQLIPSSQNNLVQNNNLHSAQTTIPGHEATTPGAAPANSGASDPRIPALVAGANRSIFNEGPLLKFDHIAFIQSLMNKLTNISKNLTQLSQESIKHALKALESAFAAAAKDLKACAVEFGLKMGGVGISSAVMGPALGRILKNAGRSVLRLNNGLQQLDTQAASNQIMKANADTTVTGFFSNATNSVGEMSAAPLKQSAAELRASTDYIRSVLDNHREFFKNHEDLYTKILDALKAMDEAVNRAIQFAPR